MNKLDQIRRYREHPNINQSKLKDIIKGNFSRLDSDEDYFNLGDLVDCKLTTPELEQEMFHVVTSKIGDKPKKIVDKLVEFRSWDDIPNQVLLDLMNFEEYRMTYKDLSDTRRFDKLREEAEDYFNELQAAAGKTIVTEDMVILSNQIVSNIKESRFTNFFWYVPSGVMVYNQVVILFELEGIKCKAMLDRVLVNTNSFSVQLGAYTLDPNGVIIIDYKTMSGPTKSFSYQARRFRYDFQASFYRDGLTAWKNTHKPEWIICDFFFIIESTTAPGKPRVYRQSDLDYISGKYGMDRQNGEFVNPLLTHNSLEEVKNNLNLPVLGYTQALKLYQWHQDNEEWEYEKKVIDNAGIINTTIYDN